ncbi:MAG TPA: PAC2 family protein [Candidatus Bathyarchaeia archaeon]|nr:PAC2 family protein [Candidatus Bathyarchaeia archaeon]
MSQNNLNIITKIEKEHKLKNGVLIQCFPGQGLVGRIAGMQLIEYFNAKEDAKIYSSHFPHLVIFNGNLGKLVHGELWVIESTTPPIVVLTGESQPQEGPQGMFEVLITALDIAINWGVTKVVAIGGFRPADIEKTAEVTGFAYSEKDTKTLKQNKIDLFTEGRVSGAVGVLTALAAERGLESFGIMGKVRPSEQAPAAFGVDPIASKNVLKALKDLLGFDMDLTKMDEMISEIEESEANAMKAIEDLNRTQGQRSDRRNYYL